MKKKVLFAFLIIFVVVTGYQCSEGEAAVPKGEGLADGAALFRQYCVLCHGADGKLGMNGAKDLTASQLDLGQRVALITQGKSTMTPFGEILTPEEIEAVAKYTLTLSK